MKLKNVRTKLSFIFVMLMIPLTLFCVYKNTKAEDVEKNYVAESIISWVMSNDLPSGDYNVTVTGKTSETGAGEVIVYPIELVNYDTDVTYAISNADEDGYVKLGDDKDEYRMLVVKYNKNLTVEQGVTLTANTHTTNINDIDYELTYKKGMLIYVKGTLTNNGTISMTARGTYNQAGENVYLWQNDNGSFEYVPADGAKGAESQVKTAGIDGNDGEKRQTGGGGSGVNGGSVVTGSGSTGTSYSGGSGGGAGGYSDG